jgi:hypothetical protein
MDVFLSNLMGKSKYDGLNAVPGFGFFTSSATLAKSHVS